MATIRVFGQCHQICTFTHPNKPYREFKKAFSYATTLDVPSRREGGSSAAEHDSSQPPTPAPEPSGGEQSDHVTEAPAKERPRGQYGTFWSTNVERTDRVTTDDSGLAYAYSYPEDWKYPDRTKLMEMKTSSAQTDVRLTGKSAFFDQQDNLLYVGSGSEGTVFVYKAPSGGTRKDQYSGTSYEISRRDVWKGGILTLAVGKPNKEVKIYALSAKTFGQWPKYKRMFTSSSKKGHGRDLRADRSDEVSQDCRFIAIDPSNSYLFLAGDHVLQRLNLSSDVFTDFTAGGWLCCQPVFATKGSTTYCCMVESSGSNLLVSRYDVTAPKSRTTKTIDGSGGTSRAGLAVHPSTQNLWLVYATGATSLRAQEFDPSTMTATANFRTATLPGAISYNDLDFTGWQQGACYGVFITA